MRNNSPSARYNDENISIMKIHTPPTRAGHAPSYLQGLVDTIYLNKLEVNPQDTIPDTGVSIPYMDYVVTKNKEEIIDENDVKEMTREEAGRTVLSLHTFIKMVPSQTHNITCGADEDPLMKIQQHISKDVFEALHCLSRLNKEEASEHYPTGFDLTLTGDDPRSDKRKVVSRVLTASNMIATRARRGPATFVIIDQEYVDYLRYDVPDDTYFFTLDSLGRFLGGLEIFVSRKLGNTVIIGRCPKDPSEPGLHMVTTDDDISGDIVMLENDIAGVDVKYMLAETGKHPHLGYLQFDIN